MAEHTTYAVALVAPYHYDGLQLTVEGNELVVGNGSLEERLGLRNLAVREREGDVVRIEAEDGRELGIRSVEIHPLDLVEFILDARAASRGLTVPRRDGMRPWPDAASVSADDEVDAAAGDAAAGDAGAGDGAVAGSRARKGLFGGRVTWTRRKWIRSVGLLAAITVVALALGGVIGNVVNEASGPGVGQAVEIRGPFVVRDVTGVGVDVLSPFTAQGPWELAWENLSGEGDPITIVAISNIDREERLLVDGETGVAGEVGPLPSGSYRLSIESNSSWRLVVSVIR